MVVNMLLCCNHVYFSSSGRELESPTIPPSFDFLRIRYHKSSLWYMYCKFMQGGFFSPRDTRQLHDLRVCRGALCLWELWPYHLYASNTTATDGWSVRPSDLKLFVMIDDWYQSRTMVAQQQILEVCSSTSL